MGHHYRAETVASYFDEFAEGEWDRLVKDPVSEVNLAMHLRYLHRYVPADARVLEVGAGAGRFTIELARMGCTVVVTDISSVQLRLNAENVAAAGLTDAVEDTALLDVIDMASLDGSSFDAVVVYGGPFSYAMDRRQEALSECVRVLRPGGTLLTSVMSLWGSAHNGLPFVLAVPPEANDRIIQTGDITRASLPGHRHECHAFRGAEFRDFIEGSGLEVLAMAASTALSTAWKDRLAEVRQDPVSWGQLLKLEFEACAQPGMLECGQHMIAVGRKPPEARVSADETEEEIGLDDHSTDCTERGSAGRCWTSGEPALSLLDGHHIS